MFRNSNNSNRARHPGMQASLSRGFTLLEMMIVMVVIMILAAVAATAYQRHITQAREAVLRENVHQLNKIIQEYTMDNNKAPQALEDLVSKGYLHEIPLDPLTKQANWESDPEDSETAADPQEPGIKSVHSAAEGTGSDGIAYSSYH